MMPLVSIPFEKKLEFLDELQHLEGNLARDCAIL